MIRYGLRDLSARNGHHAFEEMCRFLAAARIASNVYPATGPVSAGGDAGRDFQTYASTIRKELGPHGGFAGISSGEPIAFACTLQTRSLPTKIRRDLRKIASGPSVSAVWVLVASDIPAAKAEELKAEATAHHRFRLEILDGQAIAEMLSDPEVFWIAARWLAIPAELTPRAADHEVTMPGWYRESRDRWRAAERTPANLGEALDVASGLRRATFHKDARPDLGFWLSWLSPVAGEDRPLHLRQRARYEVSVAQLRGAGDLRPADPLVEAFLQDVDPATASWAELMDAAVLTSYVGGAILRHCTRFDVEWVVAQTARLRAGVEERLRGKDVTPTVRAGLLDVLGFLRAQPDLTALEVPADPLPRADLLEGDLSAVQIPSSARLVDADGAIEAWTRFAKLVPKAPLVPVDALSRTLAILAPALVDRPGYRELMTRSDDLLAESAGNSAAAERCRDRAMALLEMGRPLDAIDELHEAKARWWRGDTARGSMLALLVLSRCYEELGLSLAARQQALVAVGLAGAHGAEEDGDIIARGLMAAAHIDYRSGAWCAALARIVQQAAGVTFRA